MKRFWVVFFFGLTMVISGTAFADAGMCGCGQMGKMDRGMMKHEGMMEHDGLMGHMGDHQQMMRMMMTSLGLDEMQKEAIKGIHHRVMIEMIRKKADKEIAHMEMKELKDKDPMDMKAVEAKVKQIGDMRTDMQLTVLKAKEEVMSKLTPDQKKKMKEMMAEHHNIMGAMGGHMGKGMKGDGMCGCMEHQGCMKHHEGKDEGANPSMEHNH
jgi:Spy/CpxP family protein refolding chaperone